MGEEATIQDHTYLITMIVGTGVSPPYATARLLTDVLTYRHVQTAAQTIRSPDISLRFRFRTSDPAPLDEMSCTAGIATASHKIALRHLLVIHHTLTLRRMSLYAAPKPGTRFASLASLPPLYPTRHTRTPLHKGCVHAVSGTGDVTIEHDESAIAESN